MSAEVLAAAVSKSCDDLVAGNKDTSLPRSHSCHSLTPTSAHDETVHQLNKQYIPTSPAQASKEEYLEEINNRLVRELEEKNATLQQLQENYEHLLLKYAEAQNKIDNLRFQTNHAESSSSHRKRKMKTFMKKLPRPLVYNDPLPAQGPFTDEGSMPRNFSLALEPNIRGFEKDLKAVTPTDSEGMSSVVTSMSGHSKILTNFDEKEEDKKTALKTQVLEKTLPVFEKVTHWQNSLPPLEMIEKPDTGFYESVDTPSTRYNDPPLSDGETPEWSPQLGLKKYLRTLSLPSSLTRRNMLAQIYKKRNHHTIDISPPLLHQHALETPLPPMSTSNPHVSLIRRKNHPKVLRSASLPVYQYDSPHPSTRCPVPPLNLENLTLTEDESSPDSQNQPPTSPTFLSHSLQTLDSLNGSMSDRTPELCRTPCLPAHKSTSITPDRSQQFFSEGEREFGLNCCNICGEVIRSASNHGLHKDTQQPICRSFSINSNVSPTPRFPGEDAFDVISTDLKNRSHVTMKALAAHVKNS